MCREKPMFQCEKLRASGIFVPARPGGGGGAHLNAGSSNRMGISLSVTHCSTSRRSLAARTASPLCRAKMACFAAFWPSLFAARPGIRGGGPAKGSRRRVAVSPTRLNEVLPQLVPVVRPLPDGPDLPRGNGRGRGPPLQRRVLPRLSAVPARARRVHLDPLLRAPVVAGGVRPLRPFRPCNGQLVCVPK